MRKNLIIIFLFLILFSICGCDIFSKEPTVYYMQLGGEYIESEKNEPLKVHANYYSQIGGEDVMPIGVFCGPHDGYTFNGTEVESMLQEKYFDLFKECGFNFFTNDFDGDYNPDATERFLTLCDQYNFGVFVSDSSIMDKRGSLLSIEQLDEKLLKYINHSSFLGCDLKDEPSIQTIKYIKKTLNNFRESDYGCNYDMYYNAFPDYASGMSLSGTDEEATYEEYVRAYIEELGATYFSYDYYPFGKFDVISNGYFRNMAQVRNLCLEYEIPFWTFIECGADFGGNFKECLPDEGKFMWNISTCLAYGAKGIQYFTLCQPLEFVSKIDKDAATRQGMFGIYNNINQWYYYAKKANEHIKTVDEYLMHMTSTGIILHGESPCEPSNGNEIIASGKYNQLISVEGDDSLIGCFDYYGATAFYVVNNSVTNNDASIILKFDNAYGFDIIQRTTKTEITGNALKLRLDVGEGVLVIIK